MVREAVKQAVEEEREAMFQAFEYKLNNVIEQRDRHLTKELHRSLEEKRLEIAASKRIYLGGKDSLIKWHFLVLVW